MNWISSQTKGVLLLACFDKSEEYINYHIICSVQVCLKYY